MNISLLSYSFIINKNIEKCKQIYIRKTSSKFLELVNTSEPNWLEIIKTEGDKLCNEYIPFK